MAALDGIGRRTMAARPGRKALTAALTSVVMAAVALTPLVVAEPAGAQTENVCTETFDYSGALQGYTVPTGVTSIIVDASGASGGSRGSGIGGLGGSVRATLTVTPGETLRVSVGRAGDYFWPPFSGTFGGGGASAGAAGQGGGASDVRQGGSALADRVVVAGGGGGVGGGEIRANGGNGGHPAGATGANSPDGSGDSGGFGGTQTGGGAGGSAGSSYVGTAATAGALGQGGTGGVGTGTYAENYGGGGGGGGYYGGGGGKGGSGYQAPVSYNDGGGGGGGSSFGPPGAQFVSGVVSGDGQVVFTVVGPDCLAPPHIDPPSQECNNGPVVTDGFSADGTAYTKLRTHDDAATGERWVCFRVDGGTVHAGGKLIVSDPASGVPSVPDDNGAACGANTDPNTVPGPHPLVSGEIGPDNAHVEADVFADGEEAWVCLVAGGVSKRVIVPAAETSGTRVERDPAAQYAFPAPWPLGPSRFCKDQGGAATVDHLNTDIGTDSGHVWLTTWQQSATRAHLCFRAHTAVGNRGAVITVDTTAGGISPQVGSDASMAPCTVNVVSFTNPVTFFVKASPAGANPASVCVKVTTTEVRGFVGATGAPVLPITCTEDPGTPDIC